MSYDERITDEATGLPPLETIDPADTILLLAWNTSEGIAASPMTNETQAVHYLHVRGLVTAEDGGTEWAQVFVAIPYEAVLDVAAALAKGTTEQLA